MQNFTRNLTDGNLIKELSLPNLECRDISRREIDSQFFTGAGNVTVPNISKSVIL